MPDRPGVDDHPGLNELARLWREGSADLDSRIAAVWADVRQEVRRVGAGSHRAYRLQLQARRLEELSDVAEHVLDSLVRSTEEFLESGSMAVIYSAGAQTAASTVGAFRFTAPHRAAVEVLATDTFTDVLEATRFVEADSKAWVRRVSRMLTSAKVTGGEPVKAQARRFERELRKEFSVRGIGAVTYRDGSRHSFGEYAEMLLRTKTGMAYNVGTLNHSTMAGIRHFEILDGVLCGLTEHHDPQLANGMIVPAEIAQSWPLGHPNAMLGGQLFRPVGALREVVRARYSGPAVRIHTSEEDGFAVTPEHPVLTGRGWVAASEIEPGDYVLGHGSRIERERTGSHFDKKSGRYDAFAAAIEIGSHSVAVPAADDLHGAGRFCDPEIDVVDLHSVLVDHVEAVGAQGTRDPSFAGRSRLAAFLSRLGPCYSLRSGPLRSPGSSVRWSEQGRSGLRVGVGPSALHGLGSGHHRETVSTERRPESGLADGQTFGLDDLTERNTLLVHLMESRQVGRVDLAWCWHRVSSVERFTYSGFIYDASTADESYLANGFLVANCRRAFAPRPDVTRAEAGSARSVVSEESRRDQTAFEEALRRQSERGRGGRRERRARRERRPRLTAGQRRQEAARTEARAGNARRRARIEEARAAAARARRDELAGERLAAAGSERAPEGVLERWGITEDQWLNGRAVATRIKRDIRTTAAREADELAAWLSDNSLDQLTRPDRLRQTRDVVSGQARRVRDSAGYDFLEGLTDAELRRVRGRMTDADLFAPDLLGEQVRRVTNLDMSDDEAMQWLVDQWLREDGLRSVASGRIPRYANPENLIPADYGLEGYRLADLFGVDVDEAAGHVAQIQAAAGREYAERVLGRPRFGPNPWEMDPGDYVRELEAIDDLIASATVEAPVPENVRLRLLELAPSDIDPTGEMAPMEIFERIRVTAQTAGYAVP